MRFAQSGARAGQFVEAGGHREKLSPQLFFRYQRRSGERGT
jgi:hypothetical protein